MQGAPERKNGEDGLPVPPYAVYNIGNQNPENLLDFVQILQEELIRAGVLPEDYDFEAHKKLVPMQPGDVPVTYADTSALERDFGYKPSTSLREGFQGNLFGPVFYLVTWVAASLIISWFLINRGYKLGINSLSVMSDSVMGRLGEALTQIGLMVIGGLSATYVAVSTPLVIAGSGGADDTVVQAILDNILPNLLPLGLVGLCYWLMTKKKCSPIVLILILFVLGTVLSVLGILG